MGYGLIVFVRKTRQTKQFAWVFCPTVKDVIFVPDWHSIKAENSNYCLGRSEYVCVPRAVSCC